MSTIRGFKYLFSETDKQTAVRNELIFGRLVSDFSISHPTLSSQDSILHGAESFLRS